MAKSETSFDSGKNLVKPKIPNVKLLEPSDIALGTGTKTGFKPYVQIDTSGVVNPSDLAITQPKPDTTSDYSWWDTFKLNTAPIIHSVAAGMAEDATFQRDVNYDSDADYEAYKQAYGIRNTDDAHYLLSAPSAAAFQYRTGIVEERKKRDDAFLQYPSAGLSASILDADLGVGVLLPEVKGGTMLARMGQRAAYAAGAMGATGGVLAAQGSANPMSDTEKTWAYVGMGLSGLFVPSARSIANSAASGAVDHTLQSTPKTTSVDVLANNHTQVVGSGAKTTAVDLTDSATPQITRSTPTTLPEDVLQRGKPYTARSSAQTALQAKKLTKTHEIVEVEPNKFVLRPKQTLSQAVDAELESLKETTILDDISKVEQESTHLPSDSQAHAVGAIPIGDGSASITARVTTDQAPDALPKKSIERKFYNYILSVGDQLRNYVPNANSPVHKLVASIFNRGDNVVESAAHSERTWQYMLKPLKTGLDYGVRRLTGVNPVLGRIFKSDYTNAYKQLSRDFVHHMQLVDNKVVEYASQNKGIVMSDAAIHNAIDSLPMRQTMNVDPTEYAEVMRNLLKNYVDSKFATDVYDRFTGTKLLNDDTAEQLLRRPTYLPVDHSYSVIRDLAESGSSAATAMRTKAIAEFIGNQIMRMYPNINNKEFMLTPEMVGQHFIETQRKVEQNFGIRTIGYTKEGLHDLLTSTGKVSAKTALDVVDEIYDKVEAHTGGVTNFKRRIDWDWNAKGSFTDGTEFTMADLVNPSITGTLDRYTNSMAKRTALAEYGIGSEAALEGVWKTAMESVPKQDRLAATRLFESIHNSLMGKPIGEQVHPVLRSLQTVAGMMNLANSGIFNLADLNTQLLKLGYLRSFPHMLAAVKPVLKGMKGYTAKEAKSIEDVITGKLMVLDSWKPFINRYGDQFEISSMRHEAVEYFGQATRFLNGSEFIKRYQIGLFAGVYVSAMKGASKGVKADIKFLKHRIGMSDELIGQISQQFNKHGSVIDAWDADIRRAMERKVFHEADNMAHTVHEGEIPELMQYSAVGKVIFPYMRYTFAMTNKMLRKTYMEDGALFTAIMLAHQVPMAIIVAGLQNIQAGKEVDADIVRKTINAIPALGMLSYPIDLVMSSGLLAGAGKAMGMDTEDSKLLGNAGNTGNSAAVFTPITKTMKLLKKAVDPDSTLTPRDIKQNTVLNSIPALGILLNAVEDKED